MWYFGLSGKKIGPLTDSDAISFAQQNPKALAWKEGMANWLPISKIGFFARNEHSNSYIPQIKPKTTIADEVDYTIHGDDMQFVEIELDPGESIISNSGAMMYKDSEIQMNTIMGDGSEKGIMGKMAGIGKRMLGGSSVFMDVYTHEGHGGKKHAAFAAPYPGKIVALDLSALGGEIICQKTSFLCAAKGVTIDIFMQKKILTGFFGGEGFIMQKLCGDGMAFIHAGGTIIEKRLSLGEELHIDTGCVVAYEPSIDMDIVGAGGFKSQMLGGEGVFLSSLTGQGRVWLQSLPFSRLTSRISRDVASQIKIVRR